MKNIFQKNLHIDSAMRKLDSKQTIQYNPDHWIELKGSLDSFYAGKDSSTEVGKAPDDDLLIPMPSKRISNYRIGWILIFTVTIGSVLIGAKQFFLKNSEPDQNMGTINNENYIYSPEMLDIKNMDSEENKLIHSHIQENKSKEDVHTSLDKSKIIISKSVDTLQFQFSKEFINEDELKSENVDSNIGQYPIDSISSDSIKLNPNKKKSHLFW